MKMISSTFLPKSNIVISIARQIEEETGARVSIIDSVVTGEGAQGFLYNCNGEKHWDD